MTKHVLKNAGKLTQERHNTQLAMRACIIGLLIMHAALGKEVGEFEPPSPVDEHYQYAGKDFYYHKTIMQDLDDNPANGQETQTASYINNDGALIIKYFDPARPEKVWGWNIYNPQLDVEHPANMFLIDSNGNGFFDIKYQLTEDVKMPAWAIPSSE